MNRNFAKIVDGHIQFAPDELVDFPVELPPLDEGGEPRIVMCSVANPSPDKLRAAGYLDVITSPEPETVEGYHWVSGYEIHNDDTTGLDMLFQVWERVEDPPPSDEDEISAEEALDIILGGGDNEA